MDMEFGFDGNGGTNHLDSLIDVVYYSSIFKNYTKRYKGDNYTVVDGLMEAIHISIQQINRFHMIYRSKEDLKQLTLEGFQLFATYCENLMVAIEQLKRIGVGMFDRNVLHGNDMFKNTRSYCITNKQTNREVFMNIRAVFGEHIVNAKIDESRYIVYSIMMGGFGLGDCVAYGEVIPSCNTFFDLMFHQYAMGKNRDYSKDFATNHSPHGLALLYGLGDTTELVELNVFDIYYFIYQLINTLEIKDINQRR